MTHVRTQIIAAALAAVTTLTLVACGEADPTPDAAPQATSASLPDLPTAPKAPPTPTLDIPKDSGEPGPGGFARHEYGSEPGDELDVAEFRSREKSLAPGSSQAQSHVEQFSSLGLDPALWAPSGSTGAELAVDSLPWAPPTHEYGIRSVPVPMNAWGDAKAEQELDLARKNNRTPPLWQRLLDAGAAPDIAAARAAAAGYVTDDSAWQLHTCSGYTSMSEADEALVREAFGPLAVDIPASAWSLGGVGVLLPSSVGAKLLPCNPK